MSILMVWQTVVFSAKAFSVKHSFSLRLKCHCHVCRALAEIWHIPNNKQYWNVHKMSCICVSFFEAADRSRLICSSTSDVACINCSTMLLHAIQGSAWDLCRAASWRADRTSSSSTLRQSAALSQLTAVIVRSVHAYTEHNVFTCTSNDDACNLPSCIYKQTPSRDHLHKILSEMLRYNKAWNMGSYNTPHNGERYDVCVCHEIWCTFRTYAQLQNNKNL